MLESIVWMFKLKDFKKHFLLLLAVEVVLFTAGILSILTAIPFRGTQAACILPAAGLILFLISFLFLQGYFWELTECVIKRDIDIVAPNNYNGKIKKVDVISLPEINIKRFIWRGIASIVASVVLFLPIIFIVIGLSTTGVETVRLLNLSHEQTVLMYKCLVLFICMFIPALLYNYARRDSVFAVLNLPHAIYLIGNYTWLYFKNTFLFLIFSFCYAFMLNLVAAVFGLNFSLAASVTGRNIISISGSNIIVSGVFLLFLSLILRIYFIFVNAHLLGKIAPREEW